MKLKSLFLFLLMGVTLFSCRKDDDSGTKIEVRDEGEVALENQQQIKDFLETHFYRLVDNPSNPNYKRVEFDTIAGDNANESSIMESDLLKSKTITPNEQAYTIYYLQIREGAPSAYKPTFADRAILTYRGTVLDGSVFDEAVNPVQFDFLGDQGFSLIRGFIEGIDEFRGASGFQENLDGTISFNDDFGVGAVFIPSGLGYFNSPPPGSIIKAYQPIIFSFQLYTGLQRDHDGDGIPSAFEIEYDENGKVTFTDTDEDRAPNYLDKDDDGDGIPTADEIEVDDANGDGIITMDELTFPDTNNSGIPDYLDPEV